MNKQYYNQEAYNYIKQKLSTTEISPIFIPIIIEIILRRRYEYQLDDNYFHRDVDSFVGNVNHVFIKDLPKGSVGRFVTKSKTIYLNSELFNKKTEIDFENVLSVSSHECTHAMNYTRDNVDRTFSTKSSIVSENGILEIFTEKESDRITYSKKTNNNQQYGYNTKGYHFYTPFVNVICSSFGINEQHLLSSAIKGLPEFIKTLDTNINDINLTKRFYETIKLNINLMYVESFGNTTKNWKQNMLNANKVIYRTAEEVLDARIKNLSLTDIEKLKQNIQLLKQDQNLITKILEDRVLKLKDKDDVRQFCKPQKSLVYSKILSIEQCLENNNINLINSIQNTTSIEDILDLAEQNNISLNTKQIYCLKKFNLDNESKSEWLNNYGLDFEGWDNTEINKYISKNWRKLKKMYPDVPSSRIGKFKNPFNKKIYTLPGETKQKSWNLLNWGINKNDLFKTHTEQKFTNKNNLNKNENEK